MFKMCAKLRLSHDTQRQSHATQRWITLHYDGPECLGEAMKRRRALLCCVPEGRLKTFLPLQRRRGLRHGGPECWDPAFLPPSFKTRQYFKNKQR